MAISTRSKRHFEMRAPHLRSGPCALEFPQAGLHFWTIRWSQGLGLCLAAGRDQRPVLAPMKLRIQKLIYHAPSVFRGRLTVCASRRVPEKVRRDGSCLLRSVDTSYPVSRGFHFDRPQLDGDEQQDYSPCWRGAVLLPMRFKSSRSDIQRRTLWRNFASTMQNDSP